MWIEGSAALSIEEKKLYWNRKAIKAKSNYTTLATTSNETDFVETETDNYFSLDHYFFH